jgi:hypothetical protein
LKKIIFSFVCGIVGVLGLARTSHAQPPGITREMIATALPVEGAPLAEPGPYKVMSEPAFGSPGHVVFRPASLDAFPARDTLPVMVWGNGGCAIDAIDKLPAFLRRASRRRAHGDSRSPRWR